MIWIVRDTYTCHKLMNHCLFLNFILDHWTSFMHHCSHMLSPWAWNTGFVLYCCGRNVRLLHVRLCCSTASWKVYIACAIFSFSQYTQLIAKSSQDCYVNDIAIFRYAWIESLQVVNLRSCLTACAKTHTAVEDLKVLIQVNQQGEPHTHFLSSQKNSLHTPRLIVNPCVICRYMTRLCASVSNTGRRRRKVKPIQGSSSSVFLPSVHRSP